MTKAEMESMMIRLSSKLEELEAEKNALIAANNKLSGKNPVHPVIKIGEGVPLESDNHGEITGFKLEKDGKFTLTGYLNPTGWLTTNKKFVLNLSTSQGFKKFQALPDDNLLVCSMAIGYSKDGKRK